MKNEYESLLYQFCKKQRIIFSNRILNNYVEYYDIDNDFIKKASIAGLKNETKLSYEKLHDFVEQEQIFKLIENANLSFDNEQLNQYFHIKVNPKVASYRQKKETIELSFPQEKLYHRYRNRFDLKQQAIYELAYGFEGREKLLLRDIKVKGTKGYYNPKSLDSIINKMTRVLKRYQEWEIIKRELELYDDILTEQEKQCMVLSYGLYQPEMLHDDEIRTYLESPELDIKREKTKAFQKMKLVVKRKRI